MQTFVPSVWSLGFRLAATFKALVLVSPGSSLQTRESIESAQSKAEVYSINSRIHRFSTLEMVAAKLWSLGSRLWTLDSRLWASD